MQKSKHYLIFIINLFISINLNAQLTGLIKTGINIGTINKEYWSSDYLMVTIPYDKPLIRFALGMGVQYTPSQNWIFRQEVMYQTKGQGTVRPDVRTLFRTSNPDILHFMSFPFSIHRRIFGDLYFGLAIQPSLYLTGSDNYYATEPWHGWVYGAVANLHSTINKTFEIGVEYDYDFTYYYCEECDERFYTYRIYGIYHFREKAEEHMPIENSSKKK